MIFAALFLGSYALGYWVSYVTSEQRDYDKAIQRRDDLRKSLVNRR
jgi:hypothetical protein